MPTEFLNRLYVRGEAQALDRLERDELWHTRPWSDLEALKLTQRLDEGWAIYRYNEDWKRPAPRVSELAARHPDLTFVHESLDEFGDGAHRSRYADGITIEDVEVDAEEFDWVVWDEEA